MGGGCGLLGPVRPSARPAPGCSPSPAASPPHWTAVQAPESFLTARPTPLLPPAVGVTPHSLALGSSSGFLPHPPTATRPETLRREGPCPGRRLLSLVLLGTPMCTPRASEAVGRGLTPRLCLCAALPALLPVRGKEAQASGLLPWTGEGLGGEPPSRG